MIAHHQQLGQPLKRAYSRACQDIFRLCASDCAASCLFGSRNKWPKEVAEKAANRLHLVDRSSQRQRNVMVKHMKAPL